MTRIHSTVHAMHVRDRVVRCHQQALVCTHVYRSLDVLTAQHSTHIALGATPQGVMNNIHMCTHVLHSRLIIARAPVTYPDHTCSVLHPEAGVSKEWRERKRERGSGRHCTATERWTTWYGGMVWRVIRLQVQRILFSPWEVIPIGLPIGGMVWYGMV